MAKTWLLLWLSIENRIAYDKIDNVIYAGTPDACVDLELHQTAVMSNVVHGPCSSTNLQSPCMQVDHCSKKYIKQFISATQQQPIIQEEYPDTVDR